VERWDEVSCYCVEDMSSNSETSDEVSCYCVEDMSSNSETSDSQGVAQGLDNLGLGLRCQSKKGPNRNMNK
jgi:hypothetical protein